MENGEVVKLVELMRFFFDTTPQWPKFTYGEFVGGSPAYVYHNGQLLALIDEVSVTIRSPGSVTIRSPGSYYNYCGTLIVPLFERYIPEDPEFLNQVSNAVDIGIRLIESGKSTIDS